MKKELDEALCRDFPCLYYGRRGAQKTCMSYGFCVGDGWEPIIRRLSEKIEPECRETGNCAAQVKEKFGGLRFYMEDAQSSAMTLAIREAEDESWKTCEDCGAPGKPRRGGWIRTLCDGCHNDKA